MRTVMAVALTYIITFSVLVVQLYRENETYVRIFYSIAPFALYYMAYFIHVVASNKIFVLTERKVDNIVEFGPETGS
jgi:hypothetical protein